MPNNPNWTLHEIVEKLVGPIRPQGEGFIDEQRMENLKATMDLVDALLSDIGSVARLHDSHLHSVRKAGEHARAFLVAVRTVATFEDVT